MLFEHYKAHKINIVSCSGEGVSSRAINLISLMVQLWTLQKPLYVYTPIFSVRENGKYYGASTYSEFHREFLVKKFH